jgi:hypothetical protein
VLKEYITPLLVALLLILGIYSYVQITSLEIALLKSKNEASKYEKQSNKFEASLDSQTMQIESLRVDLNKSTTEFNIYKAQPREVKFKQIIKYLPSEVIIKRSNCEDINNYFDAIDNLNLDSL